jgi:hypothetical protein
MTASTLTIPRRFNGPPESANGGYTCGALARRLGGTCEVRLHRPPPLERPLELKQDEGGITLLDGDQLVARCKRAQLRMDIPEPPGWEAATFAAACPRATAHFPDHPFPTCFACGPQREEGDGLRLFPGPVEGRDIWAFPWVPGESMALSGVVPVEVVWAALDCPSSVPVMDKTPIVLGTLTASRLHEIHPGRRYVITSWPKGNAGRKRFSGVAMFDEAEELVAAASAVWIELSS